jgi:uncharacterized protein YecE (DUF72 family)
MKLHVGTSGYSYTGWRGIFYPDDLPAGQMLRFYAGRLPAVEINNPFYRLPRASVLESWAAQVPGGFRFALKASRRITHLKRLKEAADETAYLARTVRTLGKRLGVILFQLPPTLRKDLPRLEQFLDLLSDDARAAFEFRHPSWHAEDVFECLRARGCALCVADTGDDLEPQLVSTANWGYLRLRRPGYAELDLKDWVKRVHAQNWQEAYVFFKHENAGEGPKLAMRFLELADQGSTSHRSASD